MARPPFFPTHLTIRPNARLKAPAILLAGLLLLSACSDFRDQARYEPLEASEFFSDRRSSRPLVDGTVPWSADPANPLISTGRDEAGDLSEDFPFEITREVLEAGRESYDIYCTPCHGYDGYGQGIVVQRGFSAPPSLHEERLREAPAGYYFEVITNGFGQMYAYGYRVKPAERWAITAYIRALQVSQNAPVEDLPAEDQQKLQETQP